MKIVLLMTITLNKEPKFTARLTLKMIDSKEINNILNERCETNNLNKIIK